MKRIDFEEALRRKGEYIYKGDGIEMLNKKGKLYKQLTSDYPISFERVIQRLREELDDIGFIEFWGRMKIYKMVGGNEEWI